MLVHPVCGPDALHGPDHTVTTQAMVFAAGLGKRLAPLTDRLPKCLVPIAGRPMIDHVLERLADAGFTRVVINTFHEREQVHRHFDGAARSGLDIALSDETRLLDTGGGLRHALPLLDQDAAVLVHNCDVATDANLHELLAACERRRDDATLLAQSRDTRRPLLFDADGLLLGRGGADAASGVNLAFSGVQVVAPSLFGPLREYGQVFSIIEFYIDMARRGAKVRAHRDDDAFWMDLGTANNLREYERRPR